jgi:hypothetical protein
MRHSTFFIKVAITLSLPCTGLYAQSVQLVYTQAGLSQALAIKSAITGMKVEVWPAASLINISTERQGAYLAKLATVDCVVIIGEDALKAATAVAYPVPVVIINANGDTAAKAAVVRVFDGGFGGTMPAGSQDIAAGDGVSGANKTSRNLALKCQGITAGAAVKKLVAELAR